MSIDPTAPKPFSGKPAEPGNVWGLRRTDDMQTEVQHHHPAVPLDASQADTRPRSDRSLVDRVELSKDQIVAGNVAGGTEGLAKTGSSLLQDVLQRLASGFYDTAQVRDTVAQRVRRELDP